MPSHLTLPSRGRLTAGFAVCKPPLMSNVRPRASQIRSMLVQTIEVYRNAAAEGGRSGQFVKQQLRCIGAGRPSVGGRRSVSLRHGFLQHRLGLSVLWRPAHQRFGSENMQRPNEGLCSAAMPSLRQSVKRSLSANSHSRATEPNAKRSANTNTESALLSLHALRSEVSQRATISPRSVLFRARPNPSVNRTSNSGLRPLSAAGYLER